MFKILSYVTHTPHQYDIANALYDSQMDIVNGGVWSTGMRPVPQNVRFIDQASLNDYDVALFHMGGETGPSTLLQMAEQMLPVILICHGCPEPFMTGSLDSGYDPKIIANQCGNHLTVCCCEKEMIEWRKAGLKNATFIWHGMKDEFTQCQYDEKKAIIVNSGGWPYLNNVSLLEELHRRGVAWMQRDYQVTSFDQYRDILSKYNVYISGTKYSSFPRSRAEAMQSGLCVLTTNNWDEDKFIEDGKNGIFISEDPSAIMTAIDSLDMSTIKRIGKAGQATAKSVFGLEAYREKWIKTIKSVL